MVSKHPADSYDYRDKELSMRLPSYLAPKKGMRFFSGRSRADKGRPIINVAVDLPNEALAEALWSTLVNAPASEWMGVRQSIVRRGKARCVTEGLEMLSSSYNTSTGETLHDYHVLFLAGSRRVYAHFFGQGSLDLFDRLCCDVVASIRLEAGASGGSE